MFTMKRNRASITNECRHSLLEFKPLPPRLTIVAMSFFMYRIQEGYVFSSRCPSIGSFHNRLGLICIWGSFSKQKYCFMGCRGARLKLLKPPNVIVQHYIIGIPINFWNFFTCFEDVDEESGLSVLHSKSFSSMENIGPSIRDNWSKQYVALMSAAEELRYGFLIGISLPFGGQPRYIDPIL